MTITRRSPNTAARSVRDYLTQQGMAASSVTSKGFGKTQPVASNDTAQGRQENRRVEIVISGEVIGTEIGKVIAARIAWTHRAPCAGPAAVLHWAATIVAEIL